MHRSARVFALSGLLLAVLGGVAVAAPAPEVVVGTVAKLEAITLDTDRTFPANGQLLEREGLRALFHSGEFRPVTRADGRIVGLVFEGAGELSVQLPSGDETRSWQASTNFSPLDMTITGAFFRFSDLTADDLLGERTSVESKDSSGSAFRLYESRRELLDDPTWTRRAPHLLVDLLRDLYGGGAVGGHLLAEFRLAGDGPPNWLSYYSNARGALMDGETTAWYRVRKRGGAPPLLTVLASFGASAAAAPEYDVSYLDLDLTFPTASRGSRDLVEVVAKAELGLVALNPYGLEAVVLELELRRTLCNAQTDRQDLRITKVVDGEGNALAAIHRKNRVVIPLARAIPRGESLTLSIEYSGPMTQGIPTGPPDTMFSELGPWAFYPRNPHLDRFASKVSLHLPRFLRGIAPGDLVSEDEGKDGWSYSYDEPGGVRTLMVVVGDFVRTKPADEGANPRIITWVPRHVQEQLHDTASSARGMVEAVSSLWGPYPYSTLQVVANAGYPARNWAMTQDGASGSWSCLAPGGAHPWESFADRPSGMLVAGVTTAPAFDVIESRFMDRFATEGLSVGAFLQVVDLTRQWWGHMVPPRTYRDVWLTEALSVWTGLAFLRAAGGLGAMKEKVKTLRDLAVEGGQMGLPLGLGARLDRQFLFDGWGRGPLLVHALVDELGGERFQQATNALIHRASGPGISSAVFAEALTTHGTERTVRLATEALDGRPLPKIEYVVQIDKAAGVITLRFDQLDQPLPLTIPIELVFGPKKRLARSVAIDGLSTEVRWEMPDLPKRVLVDPLGLVPATSLKRGAGDMSSDATDEDAP